MSRDARTAITADQTTAPSARPSATRDDAVALTSAPQPAGPSTPVELNLAVGALKILAVAAIPVCVVAWVLAGTGGLLGAAIATAIVGGMYAMSGAMLSWAARIGPEALLAAALGGFALRLMIYALLIVLLSPVQAIHGESLAISAAVLLVITLAFEVRLVSRSPQLFWINAAAAKPHPASSTRTDSRPPTS